FRFSLRRTLPELLRVSCTKDSVAVKRSTFPTNSCILLPALSSTSARLHAAPPSTGGTFSSTSGGSQRLSFDRGARLAEALVEPNSRESALGCSEVRSSGGA